MEADEPEVPVELLLALLPVFTARLRVDARNIAGTRYNKQVGGSITATADAIDMLLANLRGRECGV